MPGTLYFGNSSSRSFAAGQASLYNWIVGGTGNSYADTYAVGSKGIRTSFANYVQAAKQSGIPFKSLSCNFAACVLDFRGSSGGVYYIDAQAATADDTLHITSFATRVETVLLVKGNVDIAATIDINTGEGDFLAVISSGDIMLNRSVGDTTPSCPPDSHVEGFFSADLDIVIDGAKNCTLGPDRMLGIQGAVVANAARLGGSLKLNRTLCDTNRTHPVLTITERPDMILSAPEFLKQQNFIWREVVP
jgi:hypothetical protein